MFVKIVSNEMSRTVAGYKYKLHYTPCEHLSQNLFASHHTDFYLKPITSIETFEKFRKQRESFLGGTCDVVPHDIDVLILLNKKCLFVML